MTEGTVRAGKTAGTAAGTHRKSVPPGAASRRVWAWSAGATLAVLLFAGYLRVSWTVAATSDGAAQALQARDMLAGNWLLHGWTVSDVSFYTTELPEYVLTEIVRPLGPGVIHVAAAVTYTLLVLGAFALARGRARGRAGLLRGLLAAGIMLAPQPGNGAFVLLLSPDHVGTQVPLLLGWLLLDRAGSSDAQARPRGLGRRRWHGPATLCLLLAWVQLADRVALLTAVLPLVIVCGVSLVRAAVASGRGREPGWRQGCRLEGELALAAAASAGVAWAGARLLDAAGGFTAHPLPFTLAPLRLLWTHAWLTGWGVLEVYGANFLGVTGRASLGFAALHLAGLALAVAGTGIALRRFPRSQRARLVDADLVDADLVNADLVNAVLAVAVVTNLASYVLSIEPGTVLGTGYDAREIAAVLPLGAVLAGRVFGPELARLTRIRAFSPVPRFAGPPRTGPSSSIPGPARGAQPGRHPAVENAGNDFPSDMTTFVSDLRVYVPPELMGGGGQAPELMGGGGRARELMGGGGRARDLGRGGAESRARSGLGILAVLGFGLGLAGYASALGYSAAQAGAGAAGADTVLADWLTGHGLRYGLGGASANIVTLDSGGRAAVAGITVSQGRLRPLLYQSSAAAYDPRLHDATFLVAGAPAARAGAAAEAIPAAAVRAAFGTPVRVYRFRGFTIEVWNVNLLTRLRK